MKLNNKGFAITSILYGLLILFVVLVGSYLTILSAKKNKLDVITEEIDKEEGFNTCLNKNGDTCTDIETSVNFPYTAEYTGKYIFKSSNESCSTYLFKGQIINTQADIKFIGSCTGVTNTLLQIYY